MIQRSNHAGSSSPTSNKVLLITMPFAWALCPSIGLSLLRAQLVSRGIDTKIRYMNIRFARRIGHARQNWIAARQLRLLGDWIFTPSLWGEIPREAEAAFWADAKYSLHGSDDRNEFDEYQNKIRMLQREAREFVKEEAAAVDWTQYRIIGFTSVFQQDVASLAFAQEIKRRSPDTIVVFGGAHYEAEMGAARVRNYPFIDFAFSGEADQTFPRFVEDVLAGRQVEAAPGLIKRDPVTGEVACPSSWVAPVSDLDSLPYPDYDDFYEQLDGLEEAEGVEIPFESARGCWWGQKHHCTFCGLNGGAMGFRSKSAERLLDEVKWLYGKYSGRMKCLMDVTNILDVRYFRDFIPALGESGQDYGLFFETKANLTRDQLHALAKAKVQRIQPGIESLSTSILKLMRKGCSMLQNLQLLKWRSVFGVVPPWNFLCGFPGEDPEEYEKMRRLIPSICHLPAPFSYGQVRIDRFSPYFSTPEEFGISNLQPHRLYSKVFPFDDKEIRDLAYYFEYGYADGRDLCYLDPFLQEVEQWMDHSDHSSLVGFEGEGGLLVWDTRPVAESEWTSLRGVLADVVRFCDAVHSKSAVRAFLSDRLGCPVDDRFVSQIIEELSKRKYVVEEGESVLSIIVLTRFAGSPSVPPERIDAVELDVNRVGSGSKQEVSQ